VGDYKDIPRKLAVCLVGIRTGRPEKEKRKNETRGELGAWFVRRGEAERRRAGPRIRVEAPNGEGGGGRKSRHQKVDGESG